MELSEAYKATVRRPVADQPRRVDDGMRYACHAVMGPRLEFMEFVLSCSEDERARFIRRVCWAPPARLDTYFGWFGDELTSIDILWSLDELELINWCIVNAEPDHGMPRGIEERRYQPEDEQINASIPFPSKIYGTTGSLSRAGASFAGTRTLSRDLCPRCSLATVTPAT